MRRLLLLLLVVAAGWGTAAGGQLKVGDLLPLLAGESLAGKPLALPADAGGSPALIVMTFSREAGDLSKPWVEDFTKRTQQGGNWKLYQVANLEKAPSLVRGLIRRGMRKAVPAAMHGTFLIIVKEDKLWRERTGVRDDKAPCVVGLDGQGRIGWMECGAYDAQRAEFAARAISGSR